LKKVALVTGASAGLGVDFARQLSKRGHPLVLAARRKDRLQALAKELGNARVIAIDLSKKDAAAKLMADLQAKSEVVDLLVNVGLYREDNLTEPALAALMRSGDCIAVPPKSVSRGKCCAIG